MRMTQSTVGLASLAILTVGCLSVTAQQPQKRSAANARMSGTYQLEGTRSADPRRAAETATHSLPPGQRDRAYRSLLSRLEPPQTLSIDCSGRTVSIASSLGPRSSFDADGRSQSERGENGQMVTTRAEIKGDQLTVSTSGGNRDSDFSVTFESQDHGDSLLVTRHLDGAGLSRPVTIQSYYRRTANTPRWDVYQNEYDPWYDVPRRRDASRPQILVPDGTRLLATLDTPLSMRTSRSGDPFTMTVHSPSEFQGARIDGVISRVDASRENGNGQDLRVDFRTIELRGRSFEFAALLNSIRLADGTWLRVDPEGDVRGVDHGNPTIRNGAIGVAVGAIIGALAGGGKGAAIGAVVGGTGGVILSQGRGELDLPRGADVTLTALTGERGPS